MSQIIVHPHPFSFLNETLHNVHVQATNALEFFQKIIIECSVNGHAFGFMPSEKKFTNLACICRYIYYYSECTVQGKDTRSA